ncbi:hypothetical protein JM82_2353 [Olleya sp. Hel_I_94]|jgi:hypothetical protein|nr:hypothetical protein JM82_2353 [Olleya sp. Hel_I_94]
MAFSVVSILQVDIKMFILMLYYSSLNNSISFVGFFLLKVNTLNGKTTPFYHSSTVTCNLSKEVLISVLNNANL